MRMFVFTGNDGTLSVHRTPRGAYDAARVFLADQVNKAARYTQQDGANPYEYYGEMGIINGFQDKPAETLEFYQPGGPRTPLYINRDFLARWVSEVIAAGGYAVITEKPKRKPGRARFWDADKFK